MIDNNNFFNSNSKQKKKKTVATFKFLDIAGVIFLAQFSYHIVR